MAAELSPPDLRTAATGGGRADDIAARRRRAHQAGGTAFRGFQLRGWRSWLQLGALPGQKPFDPPMDLPGVRSGRSPTGWHPDSKPHGAQRDRTFSQPRQHLKAHRPGYAPGRWSHGHGLPAPASTWPEQADLRHSVLFGFPGLSRPNCARWPWPKGKRGKIITAAWSEVQEATVSRLGAPPSCIAGGVASLSAGACKPTAVLLDEVEEGHRMSEDLRRVFRA